MTTHLAHLGDASTDVLMCWNGLHEMTDDNVRIDGKGHRHCRECRRQTRRRYRARKRGPLPEATTPMKAIPGWEGLYSVTPDGRVYSHRGHRFLTLTQWDSRYLSVDLYNDYARKKVRVHTLVALAYLGPPPDGARVVRHLNDDPHDNRVENLAYGTFGDNNRDTVRNGGHWAANKTHCKRGHEFTPENTYPNGRNGRGCKACRKDLQARYRAKRAGGGA